MEQTNPYGLLQGTQCRKARTAFPDDAFGFEEPRYSETIYAKKGYTLIPPSNAASSSL